MAKEVTTTYLEMVEPGRLIAKACPDPAVRVAECAPIQAEFAAFLYDWVGGDWQWEDRLLWTADQWAAFAADANVRMWVAYSGGRVAGFFELIRDGGDVEIKSFGLTPEFVGSGLGGYLLAEAIRRAWDWDASRVWVHTCTLDHKAALPNYKARGMTVYKEETVVKE